MSHGRNTMDATVWAAEHGASNPDIGASDESPANVGHRFRIHGRLEEHDQEPLLAEEPGMRLEPEFLRRLVARESEVDIRDVKFKVEQQSIVLDGSVHDEGERQELEALLARIPGVRGIHNRLRIHNA